MMKLERWKPRIPVIVTTLMLLITTYAFFWSWAKILSFTLTHYRNEKIFVLPDVFGRMEVVPLLPIFIIGAIAIFAWLVSTRVTFYRKKYIRLVVFYLTAGTIWGMMGAYGMSLVREHILPFFVEKLKLAMAMNDFVGEAIFNQSQGFLFMLVMIPLLLLLFITFFIMTRYLMFDVELNAAFFAYEWKGNLLRRFAKLEKTEVYPDIELGKNSKTNEVVVLPGFDRTLNTSIVGAIGTGKTAALGLPMLNQDLHHMTRFINRFPELHQRDDYESEDVSGRELNGISVIEPSNDLCAKVYQLAKAHNMPDEVITYIDPTNPNTPSINPMRGPVDKVAEVFAQVIAGLNDSKDGGSFFFEQAQRNHLKHYVYLLKMHDPDKEVTFDMLIDMYNNAQLVRKMHVQLKSRFPSDVDSIEGRDERNYWKILQGIDEWFEISLVPKQVRAGNTMMPERNAMGEILYEDAKSEHVMGLRNILNDIGANPLIRRVLFGKSDFDFDRHLSIGGILLVNTAKGELENLGRVLGKIVLMNLQNASFRRKPAVSTYHHILIDEAPEYLYNSFRTFPAQSRKYKVIITTLKQTIAQLADAFGEHYMTTIIAAMRNRMVYGDAPAYDAKYFSEMFGEKFVYQEGQSEQSVSPLQEDPVSRSGSSYSKVREQAYTAGEIMYQDAFQCAVKIVSNNQPLPVQQIQANFVPKEEFVVAKVLVDASAATIWMDARRYHGEVVEKDTEILSIEETEAVNEENYEQDAKAAIQLDTVHMEQAMAVEVTQKPRPTISYAPASTKEVRKKVEKVESVMISLVAEPQPQVKETIVEKIPVSVAPNVPSPIAKAVEPKREIQRSVLEGVGIYSEETTADVQSKDSVYTESKLGSGEEQYVDGILSFIEGIEIEKKE